MNNIKYLVEVCAQYAVKKGLCFLSDLPMVRNRLLTLFALSDPFYGDVSVPENLCETLNQMCDYAAEHNMLDMNTKAYRDLFDNRICGCLLMPQSQLQQLYMQKYAVSPQTATDWFYTLCRDSNYIRTADISKNEKFLFESNYGTLEITINLTKPEKDPKEIERLKSLPQTNYPKCMLCLENVGYGGRPGYPSHETLRTVPLKLDGDDWSFQYSPYVYYDHHCIVLSNTHSPMALNTKSFKRMFDFVRQFPHYFIGSNAPLPIVGGSILSHEHFQGGSYPLPMQNAAVRFKLYNKKYADIDGCVLSWPMTVLRFSSKNSEKLVALADDILAKWKNYNDAENNIISHTGETPHNTITPVARMRGDKFELDLVLRNNRTTSECPLGIFHPHADKHNIKKENIGLIEVMGLFILPGRLKKELDQIAEYWVSGNGEVPQIHKNWFEKFAAQKPADKAEAEKMLRKEVGSVCENVLRDAGVYKEDAAGQSGLEKFLTACGFKEI